MEGIHVDGDRTSDWRFVGRRRMMRSGTKPTQRRRVWGHVGDGDPDEAAVGPGPDLPLPRHDSWAAAHRRSLRGDGDEGEGKNFHLEMESETGEGNEKENWSGAGAEFPSAVGGHKGTHRLSLLKYKISILAVLL